MPILFFSIASIRPNTTPKSIQVKLKINFNIFGIATKGASVAHSRYSKNITESRAETSKMVSNVFLIWPPANQIHFIGTEIPTDFDAVYTKIMEANTHSKYGYSGKKERRRKRKKKNI